MSMGRMISFEGGEGAGKGTQIALLAKALSSRGLELFQTHEPGGTYVGDIARELVKFDPQAKDMAPTTRLLLFKVSQAEKFAKHIVPALALGKIVLLDRYIDSSTVYNGVADGLGKEAVSRVNDFATGGRKPDLTFLLDISVERGFARVRSRGEESKGKIDFIEQRGQPYFETIRQAYLDLAAEEPHRFVVIDADREPGIIHTEIMTHVDSLLSR